MGTRALEDVNSGLREQLAFEVELGELTKCVPQYGDLREITN